MNKSLQAEYDVKVQERPDGATIKFKAARRSKVGFGFYFGGFLIALLMILGIIATLIGLYFVLDEGAYSLLILGAAILGLSIYLMLWQERREFRKHDRELTVTKADLAVDGNSYALEDVRDVYLGSVSFREMHTTSVAVANAVSTGRDVVSRKKGAMIEIQYGTRRLVLVEGLGPDMAPDLLTALTTQMRRVGWSPA